MPSGCATRRTDCKCSRSLCVFFRGSKKRLHRNFHGYNDKDGHDSCCKWGRANGWGMLGHAEALESMAAWPEGYPDTAANAQVKLIFQ